MRHTIGYITGHYCLSAPLFTSVVELESDIGSLVVPANALSNIDRSIDAHVYLKYEHNEHGEVTVHHAENIFQLASQQLLKELPFSDSNNLLEGYWRLTHLLDKIDHPLLHPFVAKLRDNQELLKALLMLPASYQQHHDEQSGLLTHSLEVVESTLGSLNSYSMIAAERQLVIIGALFHDIGKAAHYLDTGEMRYLPNAHESCNIGIMYPELQALHRAHKLWYETLMTTWQPSSYRNKTVCIIADAVHHAAQLSVTQYMSERLFAERPSGYYFSMLNNKRHLRSITHRE